MSACSRKRTATGKRSLLLWLACVMNKVACMLSYGQRRGSRLKVVGWHRGSSEVVLCLCTAAASELHLQVMHAKYQHPGLRSAACQMWGPLGSARVSPGCCIMIDRGRVKHLAALCMQVVGEAVARANQIQRPGHLGKTCCQAQRCGPHVHCCKYCERHCRTHKPRQDCTEALTQTLCMAIWQLPRPTAQ